MYLNDLSKNIYVKNYILCIIIYFLFMYEQMRNAKIIFSLILYLTHKITTIKNDTDISSKHYENV